MATRLPNPYYTPELSAKVTIIDFALTMKILEVQLLDMVIAKEKSQLQEQQQALKEQINSYTKKTKELVDDLLRHLFGSSGRIFNDVLLI